MPMVIANDMSSTISINVLNRNMSNLHKSLEKISTGMKINGARDDASAYSISERMKVTLRGLYQDEQNVATGVSMLKVAAGGIENITNELRTLKELALNAANDHNTDQDRATLQKDFDQRIANIEDIASTTNYNGKLLLNGAYQKFVAKLSTIEPDGTPVTISSGDYTIHHKMNGDTYMVLGTGNTIMSDGVYVLGEGCTGAIRIADGVSNVKIQQADSSSPLKNVFIVGPSSGNLNLWIEDLNIETDMVNDNGVEINGSIIKFQGEGNFLTLKGTNTFRQYGLYSLDALLNIGNGLTIEATNGGTLNTTISSTGMNGRVSIRGAVIGTDSLQDSSGANLVINSGNINVKVRVPLPEDAIWGAGIGTGVGGKMGNIAIKGGHLDVDMAANSYQIDGTAIGNGSGGSVSSIMIEKDAMISTTTTTRRDGSNFVQYNTGIGTGNGGTVGNISYVDDSATKPNPLVLHIGTKANQALTCFINDMRVDALGLSTTSVTNRDKAISAINDIDSAIEYVLDSATTIGAYISRLGYSKGNIITAAENTQASESAIRDADMAKEMVEYTKNNVLAQAAQSMLAQSNQNAGNVLSLLR